MTDNPHSPYDLLIVGAGPIGLAAACAAQDAGLRFLILDKAGPCQSIVEYAPRQSFYSPAAELEVGGIPFPLAADDKPRREDALAYYRAVVVSRRLPLRTWERVTHVRRVGGVFRVTTVQQPDGPGRLRIPPAPCCSPAASGTSPGHFRCPARTSKK